MKTSACAGRQAPASMYAARRTRLRKNGMDSPGSIDERSPAYPLNVTRRGATGRPRSRPCRAQAVGHAGLHVFDVASPPHVRTRSRRIHRSSNDFAGSASLPRASRVVLDALACVGASGRRPPDNAERPPAPSVEGGGVAGSGVWLQRITLPPASSTCTSPSPSPRMPCSIFDRSPTTTQVIADGLITALAAALMPSTVCASVRALSART